MTTALTARPTASDSPAPAGHRARTAPRYRPAVDGHPRELRRVLRPDGLAVRVDHRPRAVPGQAGGGDLCVLDGLGGRGAHRVHRAAPRATAAGTGQLRPAGS